MANPYMGEGFVDMGWDMGWAQGMATPDMCWAQGMATPVNGERTKLTAGAPIFVPAFMNTEPAQGGCSQQSEKLWGQYSRQASSCSTAAPESCGSLETSAADLLASGLSESEDDADVKLSAGVQEEVEFAVPLQVSTNSWAAGQRSRRNRTEHDKEGLSHEDMTRKIKSILNKLTVEKFPALFNQLVSCGIQNKVHVKVLIHEILEKATTQHHFIDMYANLCSNLQAHFSKLEEVPNFKKLLLDAVQASFEQSFSAPVSLKRLEGDERRAAEQKYKMQMLGNIKFVGALLVRKMLAVPVMFAIIDELLGDSSPESLESLAAFLTVVGPTFDQPEFAQQFILAAIFDQVDAKTKDSQIKNRVRCLLKDVLDLRACGWLDHKPKKLEGPSTLREVAQKLRFEASSSSKNHSKPFVRQVSTQSSSAKAVSPKPEQSQSSPHSPAVKTTSAPEQPSADLEADQVKPPSAPQQSSTSLVPDQDSPDLLQDLSLDELAEKVVQFIEDNGLDEEAADDLKTCPVEVQRMVLSKGGVTCGRNPSAMLRVRINQAMRKLKLNSKAVERARATRTTGKPWASKTSQSAKKDKQEACGESLDKDDYHKTLAAIYAELMISHEIQDAVASVGVRAVPVSAQPQELCDLLVFIVEKSSCDSRAVGLKFFVAIFVEKCWESSALQEGLQSFATMCEDLKLDVPTLPSIVHEEVVTLLEPLVSSGLLPNERLLALKSAV